MELVAAVSVSITCNSEAFYQITVYYNPTHSNRKTNDVMET